MQLKQMKVYTLTLQLKQMKVYTLTMQPKQMKVCSRRLCVPRGTCNKLGRSKQ